MKNYLKIIIALIFVLLIYSSEIWLIFEVPINVYKTYIYYKFSAAGNDETVPYLRECSINNKTNGFLVKKVQIFSEVTEKYFDLEGALTCENFYAIDVCKDHCPYNKCVNEYILCKNIEGM